MRDADANTATPVALVDDDALYCEVIAQDLVDRGFVVHNFHDGQIFLDAVQKGLAVRVVLLDWTLPVMSGLEVLRTLRAAPHRHPGSLPDGTLPDRVRACSAA